MKSVKLLSMALIVMVSACSKKGNSSISSTAPTNLMVNATVSTDNSGNVAFTATATNANTYDYDFGNGIFQTVASGVVTYKYPASGSYTVNVIAKSSSGQTISKSILITVSVTASLVWSEEFDTPGLPSTSKWGYDLGAGGWGNNELEYYTNRQENAIVSGGTLKINAIKENYSGSTFTSARLLSKDKFSFKYGKIEIRAKLPAGVGSWPAIWMLGSNISTTPWPGCGEIDIMEHLGRDLNKIYSTMHYPGHSGSGGVGGTTVISNATTEFHKYGMEWSAASLKFYVDDVLFFTFANTPATPFNQNFFIILNLAIGGDFGGPVDPAFTGGTMEVDYIRVYQ
ncbi:MAG: family 16 glycosylhydrolase [Chitinophagaceae bacterium]